MRATFHILICCLYALSAVDANLFSKGGNAEVQQGNTKAAKPLNHWSDDKSYDDDKDGKWTMDDDDYHYGGKDQDECASRSVSVLIGTSTYAIPCLQGRSIVNLNGLIPTPIVTSSIASSSATEASSSAVSSSAVNAVKSSSAVESSSSAASSSPPPSSSAASSSEASSTTDSTTTNTDSTTTTTDSTTTTTDTTTTTTDSTTTITDTTTTTTTTIPPDLNFMVNLYNSSRCSGDLIHLSSNPGCFNQDITQFPVSAVSLSPTVLRMDFYSVASCAGNTLAGFVLIQNACTPILDTGNTPVLSYRVITS